MNDMINGSQALPGFEEIVKTAVDRAGSQDLRDRRYTAAVVLRDYPETFKSVAAALFKYNLPNRVIRDLYRMNGATVKGIHDMVMGAAATDGRGAFLVKCRAASTRNIVTTRLLDAILDKLDNESVIAEMSVQDLTLILNQLSPHEATEKAPNARRSDVTIVEPAQDFEAIMDGLIAEKKRALDVAEDGSAAHNPALGKTAEESSTCNN